MNDQVQPARKRRGPMPTGKGHMLNVRVHPPLLARLDAEIEKRGNSLSRPEIIRLLVQERLDDLG